MASNITTEYDKNVNGQKNKLTLLLIKGDFNNDLSVGQLIIKVV